MAGSDRTLRAIGLAATVAATIAAFAGMIFTRLPDVFRAPEEDMDYAWFVPLFSLWVLWRERARIKASLGAPSARAFALALPCMALGLLGSRGMQVRFELLGFIGLSIAAPMAFFGRKAAARTVFPAACLLFCMPLASHLSLFTVHLRLFASAAAGGVLGAIYPDVVREGNLIALADTFIDGTPFAIDIANPCSGLRSIFALMALSVCYGYLTLRTWRMRAALFALAIPLAVLGNIARIVSICVVAKTADATFATGFYHDFSGYIVFIVAILLMVAAAEALLRLEERLPEKRNAAATDGCETDTDKCGENVPGKSIVPFLYTALTATFVWAMTAGSEPVVEAARPVALPEIAGCASEALEPAAAETNLLRGATILKKLYKDNISGRERFLVTSVTSGANKNSMHRPELCLPSQGFDMGEAGKIEEAGIEWRTIALGAKGGRGAARFAYTFENQAGWRTASHEMRILRDVWDRTVNGRIDRWTMTTVFAPGATERELREILRALAPEGKEAAK